MRRAPGPRRERQTRGVPLAFLRALALASVVVGARSAGAAACDEDLQIRELLEEGDAFRAVSRLRLLEAEHRGTDEGFHCARRALGLYLTHGEHDLADGFLARLLTHYPQQLAPFGPPPRLRAEMAFLFGNGAEVRRRLGTPPAQPGVPVHDPLLAMAAVLDAPLGPRPRCAGPACEPLAVLQAAGDPQVRSPSLAATLSIVPGLGQVYAGRVVAGIGSFLVNGFFLGLTGYAVAREEHATAVFTGAVAFALWTGNIYAGWEAARRANDVEAARVVKEVQGVHLPLGVRALAR